MGSNWINPSGKNRNGRASGKFYQVQLPNTTKDIKAQSKGQEKPGGKPKIGARNE